MIKRIVYFLNQKDIENRIKRASGNIINHVQVLSGGKVRECMMINV